MAKTRAPRTVSDRLLWFAQGRCFRFAYRHPATGERAFILCNPGKFEQAGIAIPNPEIVRKKTKVAEDLCRELQRQFLASLASLRPETLTVEAPTISKAAATYLAIYDSQASGYHKTLKAIFAEFEKTIGDKPVDRITDEDLKAYERRIAKRCGRASVRSYVKQLSMLLHFCVRKGWIKQDPRATYRLPREESKAPNPFTAAELKAFFAACRNAPLKHDWSSWEWIGIGLLALGIRPIELIHADWSNVNWDERLLWIDRSHGAKEREARQHQPIPLSVWPLFEERKRERGPIWTNAHDEKLSMTALSRGRKSLSNRLPGFTWKRFRKTYATILAESGVDSIVVSRLLRHSAGGRSGTMAGKHYVGQSILFLRSIVDSAFATAGTAIGVTPKWIVDGTRVDQTTAGPLAVAAK